MKADFCTFGQRSCRKGRKRQKTEEENRRREDLRCQKGIRRKRCLPGSFPSKPRSGATAVRLWRYFPSALLAEGGHWNE